MKNSLEEEFFNKPPNPLKAYLDVETPDKHRYIFTVECFNPQQALRALTVNFSLFLVESNLLPKNKPLTNQQKLALTGYILSKITQHNW